MGHVNLPTGTVTFLYTDIESSTRRWEQHPGVMKVAVERHDVIMREALETHGGIVFRTMGDAFCASFPAASQALVAALATQQALQAEPWPAEVAPIKVRMALHAGLGEVRDDDYVGPPLNRIARLLSTGYGGQTLVSQAVYELARDSLPTGVTLRDLGEHRLKDLDRPEHVYQLSAPGAPWALPDDFPPLKSLTNRPNNLPIQRGALVGREKELREARDLLLREDTGLLTLTGPGGTGKTRLALQVAAEAIDDFPDGVYFVSLASTNNTDMVVAAIAQAVGVREVPSQNLSESLTNYLRDKQMLLVLDNFEQVVEASPLVAELLASTPRLKVLVTSREILRLQNEQEFRVPPLTLCDPKRTWALETLMQCEAVSLFIQRARLVQPNFTLTAANGPAVAEICYRLDGLPLAIELAAARTRLLPPEAMLPRLTSSLKLLTGGSRDLPARQQTLRDTIQWSYDLLPPGERMLFTRMSVFAGGCTLEAIEAVCNASGDLEMDVLDGVASLVEKSLVRQEESEEGESRFVVLQVVREYATELLQGSREESEQTRTEHARYYMQMTEAAQPGLQGPDQIIWLDRLERENDNLRAALAWSIESGDADTTLRLFWALWWFWQVRGFLSEGLKWIQSALYITTAPVSVLTRARALLAASLIEWLHNNYKMTRRYAQESMDLLREIGQEESMTFAFSLVFLGAAAGFEGDFATARPAMERAVELLRKLGDKWGLAYGLLCFGLVANAQGAYEESASVLTEGLSLSRALGNKWGVSQALNSLGDLARITGDYAEARKLYEESLGLYRLLNNRPDIPASLHNLGYVALALGDLEQSEALFADALTLQREMNNKQGLAECLTGLAGVAAARKQPARAARLFGAAEALRAITGLGMWAAERADYERNLLAARPQLDDDTWEAALAEGRAMTIEQATEYALSLSERAP
jgi:predicted ATPase/class 3 adenylate cyclase